MPVIPLTVAAPSSVPSSAIQNPYPQLLQTPTGLALLEIQGTIHFPSPAHDDNDYDDETSSRKPVESPIGTLTFPLYDPLTMSKDDTAWMKRVYLYVGQWQRMKGEVKKLGQPVGLVRKKKVEGMDGMNEEGEAEELEIVEVVKWKVVFKERPEPVGEGEGLA